MISSSSRSSRSQAPAWERMFSRLRLVEVRWAFNGHRVVPVDGTPVDQNLIGRAHDLKVASPFAKRSFEDVRSQAGAWERGGKRNGKVDLRTLETSFKTMLRALRPADNSTVVPSEIRNDWSIVTKPVV